MMSHRLKRWWTGSASCLALIAVLHGCGGGGQTASNNTGGVGSGGTGSYTNGPISGLGSIFVNGVRYDVSAANLLSDDTVVPSANDLQIGVMVEVDGGQLTQYTGTAYSTCKATRVRYLSELIGQVTFDTTISGVRHLTVMGQSVAINAATEPLDPSIVQGSTVKVYGLPGASGVFTATLVLPVSSPAAYKVSGVVAAVDTSARTISIGSGPQVVSYASGSLPSGVVEGGYVRAQVSVTPVGVNAWTALPGGIKVRAPLVTDQRDGRLEGVVQPMNASTTMGYVNAAQVDFSAVLGQLVSQCSPTPTTPATIADCVGKRVEVEGHYNNGILTATKAEKDDDSVASSHELVGTVSSLVPNTSFMLTRSGATYTVSYNGTTDVHGNVTLQSGACVQVNWQVADPANPLHVSAKEIESSTDCH